MINVKTGKNPSNDPFSDAFLGGSELEQSKQICLDLPQSSQHLLVLCGDTKDLEVT